MADGACDGGEYSEAGRDLPDGMGKPTSQDKTMLQEEDIRWITQEALRDGGLCQREALLPNC